MQGGAQIIKFFRKRIPVFSCIPGCHDCCGPVLASSEEMFRLPFKSEADREAALTSLNCPHLGTEGCQVYDERPLICRVFGTTPKLACPQGRKPETMLEPAIEKQIFLYFSQTRHVLV